MALVVVKVELELQITSCRKVCRMTTTTNTTTGYFVWLAGRALEHRLSETVQVSRTATLHHHLSKTEHCTEF